jgi:hypothetical protein
MPSGSDDVIRMVYNTPTYTYGYKLAAAAMSSFTD